MVACQKRKQLEAMWQELIHEQLHLSTNSQYILAEYASHGIENDPQILLLKRFVFECKYV